MDEIEDHKTSMSLNTKKYIVEHNLNDVWESGCIKMDRRAVQYFTQIILIGGTMIFCIDRLIKLNGCDGAPYLSLLTMLIGLMVKGPEFNKKKD